MIRHIFLLLACMPALAIAAPSIDAPVSALMGGEITVKITGSTNAKDFVTIVKKGQAEGAYDEYEYVAKPGPITLSVPPAAGDFEIRLLGATSPYPTLARKSLRIES